MAGRSGTRRRSAPFPRSRGSSCSGRARPGPRCRSGSSCGRRPVSDAPGQRGAHAPGGVAEARRALVAWVDAGGEEGRVFLEARLRATGRGRYEIRHNRDLNRSLTSLEWVSADPYFAREVAQVTNAGEHRPLKTAPTLRQGWALVELEAAGLWTALDYLYP